MTGPDTTPVWYVAYGSNLLAARFDAYLRGCGDDIPWGPHRGASDSSPATGDRRVVVPHPVFFGGHSRRWNGGCCFCPDEPTSAGRLAVVGRAWRITWGQMADVVAQENGRPTDAAFLPTEPPVPGRAIRVLDGIIDLLIGMDRIDGEPVCTLGSTDPPAVGPPSASYRAVLAAGMAEMGIDAAEAERHLVDLDRTG